MPRSPCIFPQMSSDPGSLSSLSSERARSSDSPARRGARLIRGSESRGEEEYPDDHEKAEIPAFEKVERQRLEGPAAEIITSAASRRIAPHVLTVAQEMNPVGQAGVLYHSLELEPFFSSPTTRRWSGGLGLATSLTPG